MKLSMVSDKGKKTVTEKSVNHDATDLVNQHFKALVNSIEQDNMCPQCTLKAMAAICIANLMHKIAAYQGLEEFGPPEVKALLIGLCEEVFEVLLSEDAQEPRSN